MNTATARSWLTVPRDAVGIALLALLAISIRPAVEASPDVAASSEVQREMLTHPSGEGRVELLWREPDDDVAAWPSVLFVHGHQIGDRPGAAASFRSATFDEVVARGWLAAAVSQPGYGASDGPPDFCGPRSQDAVRAALERLRRHPRVDPERIALAGVSRGAVVASMVATTDHELAALVLRAGFYDMDETYRRMEDDFGGKANLEHEAGTTRDAFLARSALLAPDSIRAPTLLIHGEDDPISPVDQVHRLAARIRAEGGRAEVAVFRGFEHRVPLELWRPRLFDFLERAFDPDD